VPGARVSRYSPRTKHVCGEMPRRAGSVHLPIPAGPIGIAQITSQNLA
jgi:hypothetical protein